MHVNAQNTSMDTHAVAAVPSPRPTPQFYSDPQTFSVKKLKLAGTPKDQLPPRPPVKSCPPLSRVFPHKNVLASAHAQPVTFRHPEGSMLSPKYNENSKALYFEQMFTDVQPIGFGSFGEVFKAKSKEDKKYYAVKKSRERFKGQFDRKRKLEEVAKHETLPPNRNCIGFVRAWEENGHLYIQTELCDLSVSEYCYQNHNLPERLIWNYMVDLLMAVKHLHDHNLVHMDIKPENAFISFDGVCKLGDFGLVIDLTKKKEVNDPVEGDPRYLAPELLEGKFGKHADIFSLGIFFLEICHNVEIPRGGQLWHLLRNGSLPSEFFRERSPELKAVITSMLETDYNRRPTVDQVLAMPSIRAVYKKRNHDSMISNVVNILRPGSLLSANAEPHTPPQGPNGRQSPKSDRDCSSDDDFLADDHDRRTHGSDLLNSSDEFAMPVDPPPRRAYTTPALRRRPATTVLNNGSPIKRTLFTSSITSTPSSRVLPTDSQRPCPDGDNRSGTPPPICSLTTMECDEPKAGIEPKNLLDMFEAASDEDDI
ncbi:membrane-associated tyrosine- and threonine-specific cdc2-inhibitory kinase [Aplysia californica]|uniref:non-specific serine/threonine protein kinase n=1 Tax=Aplysia californica TaxID=6500 RepID=A0ABM1A3E2_APLCA|nr:membrane-associated tyrosine- and threonine-specific cdc2-inhibitory kinase [Aplysia californica]